MAWLEFAREAGADVFGSGASAAGSPAGESAARRAALLGHLARYGFEVGRLHLEVDGEVVSVSGLVDQQAEREKLVLALGNVAGIARVDDRLESRRPGPAARLHTVVAGETLPKIAERYCGDASRYPAILEANRPMVQDPERIYPGQVLRIPSLAS